MKIHKFTLILTAEPNEAEADRLHSIFDDGTIATAEPKRSMINLSKRYKLYGKN